MSKENALFPEVKDAIAFDTLWQQAYELITALSGEVWTDTADHDPGVTLLQSVTWNCSDLSYRASLSLNDLLTQKDQTTLFPEEFGPDRVLTCNSVTAEDYRRALLDIHSSDIEDLNCYDQDFIFSDACLIREPEECRFHWWYNGDKREYSFTKPVGTGKIIELNLRGNLWLSVVPSRYTQSLSDENKVKVEQYLNAFFEMHRNLGESVSRIIWLEPAIFSPRMKIELSENVSDVNQVAAEVYQVTEEFLRPIVKRYTTEQRRALGDPDDSIFEGPRLLHGWQEPSTSLISRGGYTLNLGLLVNRLLAIPGVNTLSSLSVNGNTEHISPVEGKRWHWHVADGYYPLLWGDEPLEMLAKDDGPLSLVAKGGIYSPLDSQVMAGYLRKEDVIKTEPIVLHAGRFRDQTRYIPIGQRMPECFLLQQPNSVIDATTRALHQFLLPADQLLADGTAELTILPELLSFTKRGNAIRGTRWPYTNTMIQKDIHQSYAAALKSVAQHDVAIFSDNGNRLNRDNFSRELDFLQYLLGYFGTQRAAFPLTVEMSDFLATQRAYLAQQPQLGYDRINIRIDEVSALQKRIAARIGLGSLCFDNNPDLSQLPFYVIEHRQLLPKIPDSTFNSEHIPATFAVDNTNITLTQEGSAGKIFQGQLINLVAIEGENRLYVSQLLVIRTSGDSFTVSTANSQQLHNNLLRLQNAWERGNLRWQNSNVWLQDMHYRLNYAEDSLQPIDKNKRLLLSNAQTPYPTMANVGDVIVLQPRVLQFTQPGENRYHSPHADAEWELEAIIKEVDPIAGTLLIEKSINSIEDFPSKETSFHYQWVFGDSTYATKDRFSFAVSVVLNRQLLESPNIVSDKLVTWVQENIMAEFPAHISLVNHWFDAHTFKNFGKIFKRWQNNGSPLGDDAFAIMQMLTLGCLPIPQLAIGLMRIATESQSTNVTGSDGSKWDTDVILREQLFYVPQDVPTSFEYND